MSQSGPQSWGQPPPRPPGSQSSHGGPPADAGPARWWYAVWSVLAAAIVAAGAFWGVNAFVSALGTLVSLSVPGEVAVEIDGVGPRSVFREYPSGVVSMGPGALEVALMDADGQPVPSRSPRGTVTYSTGDRDGTLHRTFDVPAPGAYTLIADWDGTGTPPDVALDVAGVVGRGLVYPVLVIIAAVMISVTVLGVGLGVTASRRSRAKRALAPSPYG